MTTPARLRRAALDLPEAEEQTGDGAPAFTVRGTTFARVVKDEAELRLPPEVVREVVAGRPGSEAVSRGPFVTGVLLPLADVDGQALNGLVAQAWRHCAPPDLRERYDAAVAGTAATDLPAIGKPATRALAAAGITTMEQVAALSETELLAMHGVGPKAVRILGDVLTERGLSQA
ncbi:helix-hairpin-helix domain-containing protein [Ruania suaedae]|uniref:helix-hairpin-helix domain-containing protein n=1 Tax=Ruania suaedae TaxID=2897774 RepID=UPI001E4F3950|nr:helix-hairpin-helix domain-containing protein [Ruania suaedae]UFU02295.1 helix-hairpin-helix domain-containing protein [Ruania suaedae]